MLKPKLHFKDTPHTESILRYNKWFIQLRWLAAILVLLYLPILYWILNCNLSEFQIISILTIFIMILIYNSMLRNKLKSRNSNQIELAFWQIVCDLLSLAILVYFSGGIEAPIFLLFLFHMIIGSIILPKKMIYSIAAVLIILFTTFSILEFHGIIPHQTLEGLYPIQLYKINRFVALFLFLFSFVVLFSIHLTTKIVAELFRREEQLKRALTEIQEAEKSKQRYVMAIVHELKSPIAAATSGLDIVLGGYVGEVSNIIREKIIRVSERLAESIQTINSILHVSRFKLFNQLKKEEVDISQIIRNVIEKNREIITRKELDIIINDSDSMVIEADKSLITLAISNLLSNSIKYTPIRGKIEINGSTTLANIEISIKDDGIGVPREDQEKIFDEYYRASNVNSIEGTGTGLSLVKQIIDTHGGSISLKSPSNLASLNRPGTEVIITLPRK